ncbi:MAG: VOC family protein [Lachnospiraceae bacterium]|nr:VOC family protein [Lachnospiraceae bacterium]
MIQGLHHIAVIVSSEKTVDFYKNLGFAEIFRKERSYDIVVLLNGYDIELELFVDPSHDIPENEPLGLRHFALKVDNIESTVSSLGFEDVHIGTDWIGRKYCYITDPDGFKVELHE